jgi:uncharacterized protein
LKLSVSKIPEGGINLQFERDGEWFRGLLPEPGQCDFTLERIDVACSVRRIKETVFIEGKASTAIEAPCCRCLEPTRLPIGCSFKYTFAPPPPDPQEEWELKADDLDFAYYEEDSIDLDSVIFEQIMLQIPIKALCAESCRGLCPHCGINLNEATCNCEAETFDERLAVLKKLKLSAESCGESSILKWK